MKACEVSFGMPNVGRCLRQVAKLFEKRRLKQKGSCIQDNLKYIIVLFKFARAWVILKLLHMYETQVCHLIPRNLREERIKLRMIKSKNMLDTKPTLDEDLC